MFDKRVRSEADHDIRRIQQKPSSRLPLLSAKPTVTFQSTGHHRP